MRNGTEYKGGALVVVALFSLRFVAFLLWFERCLLFAVSTRSRHAVFPSVPPNQVAQFYKACMRRISRGIHPNTAEEDRLGLGHK